MSLYFQNVFFSTSFIHTFEGTFFSSIFLPDISSLNSLRKRKSRKKVGMRKKRENCSNFSSVFSRTDRIFELDRQTRFRSIGNFILYEICFKQFQLRFSPDEKMQKNIIMGKTQSVEISNLISVLQLQLQRQANISISFCREFEAPQLWSAPLTPNPFFIELSTRNSLYVSTGDSDLW